MPSATPACSSRRLVHTAPDLNRSSALLQLLIEWTMSPAAGVIRSSLESTFRHRIALFYRALQVTPPYHSVEKATLALRDALAALSLPALEALAADEVSLGTLYAQIVRDSGLARKHRGIIKGLLRDGPDRLPAECQSFADAYRT